MATKTTLTQRDVNDVIDSYECGESVSSIARRLKVGVARVRAILWPKVCDGEAKEG